jgi:hypothetical protein
MQPLKPNEERSVLENNPQAQPSDLEEYERLLSLRFTEDPDQRPAASPHEGEAEVDLGREARIQQLHRKLFSSATASALKSAR